MSTPNFNCSNTKKIYAMGNDSGCAQYDCQCVLEELNWEPVDKYDRTSNRSYPASIIAEKTKCIVVAGVSLDITAKAKIVAGYYDGACFDFDCELTVYDMEGYEVSSYEDLYSIYKYTDKDAVISDNWTGNKGLSKIHAQLIIDKLNKAIDSLHDEAEKAFESCCDDKLVCVAVFSNGEAMYKRA